MSSATATLCFTVVETIERTGRIVGVESSRRRCGVTSKLGIHGGIASAVRVLLSHGVMES